MNHCGSIKIDQPKFLYYLRLDILREHKTDRQIPIALLVLHVKILVSNFIQCTPGHYTIIKYTHEIDCYAHFD